MSNIYMLPKVFRIMRFCLYGASNMKNERHSVITGVANDVWGWRCSTTVFFEYFGLISHVQHLLCSSTRGLRCWDTQTGVCGEPAWKRILIPLCSTFAHLQGNRDSSFITYCKQKGKMFNFEMGMWLRCLVPGDQQRGHSTECIKKT